MRKKLFTTLFLLLIPAVALAAFPKPTGYVNDFAGVLNSATKAKLESTLTAFDQQSGIEIAVATLPSLEGEPIENVAVDLFEKWGIGKKDRDNGVLFLVAPKDKRMRIEVGYGLEGVLNDALAGRILKKVVVPYFKKGMIDSGIAMGTLSIIGVISDKEGIKFDLYGAGRDMAPLLKKEKKSGPLGTFGKIIMLLIMGYILIRHPWLFLFMIASGGGGVRRGGGGFGGGGFGGFGGGLSGGGGASSGW
jgi:uncharacterized protein